MRFILLSIMVICMSGCTSIELGAQMYKACVVKSQDGCPTDTIREWMMT